MVYYYFYEKRGYNHIVVDGDGIFKPEIVRAVSNIEYQIEEIREKDRESDRKLAEMRQKQGTNIRQRVPTNPYVKR